MNWPARHPIAAIVIALVALVAAVLGITRLRADTSLSSFFSPDDPAAKTLQHVMENYAAVDELLVLATLPEPTGEPQISQLTAFAGRLETEIRSDAALSPMVPAINYQADASSRQFVEKVLGPSGIWYLSDQDFAAAKARLTLDSMREQIRRNEAMLAAPGPAATALAKEFLKDPLRLHEFLESSLNAIKPFKTYQGSNAFLSPDGRSLLIRISGAKPTSDLAFAKDLTHRIHTAIDRAQPGGLSIDVSGAYAIASHSERRIRADTTESVIGSVVLIAFVFALAYRRPVRLFLMSMAPLLIGVAYGFGVYSLWTRSITPLTAVVGGILAGMGIDYSIEYLSQYYRRRAAGMSAVESAGDTIATIGSALLAACATSVVGFMAVACSSVRALRDFAVVGGLGLGGAFFATLWLLPALLVLFDRKNADASITAQRWSLLPLLRAVEAKPRFTVLPVVLLAIAAVAYVSFGRSPLELESDLTVLHPRPNPPLDAEARISRRMGVSPGTLLIHLQTDSAEHLVQLAHRVRDRLAGEAARKIGVTNTYGISTLLPDPQTVARRRAELGKSLADQVTADFDRAIADSVFSEQAYAPYKLALRFMTTNPPVPQPAALVPYPQFAGSILPRLKDGRLPNEALTLVLLDAPLDQRDRRDAAVTTLQSLLADLPGASLTGMAVLSRETESQVRRDLPKLLLLSIGLVALYLLIHFRSMWHMALAVLPCVFSLICWLAVMKLTGQKLNLANLAALPLLIGINTDYGIFVVSLSRRHRDHDALQQALASSSQAITLCAATTFFGFGSLAFTSVPAVRSLGWAVGVGVSACIFATLFLLVPLLLRIARVKETADERR